jgi:nucleoside-diphosphate-sugar epimerase
LTVAVTGPTGTFGFGLMPLLERDDRISRVIGIARRPFDPREHGWTKMEYRRGDVRDRAALEAAFEPVDVVIHLAFMVTGNAPRQTVREINVEGTLNAFRAAATTRTKRFVYTSSVAAYGFHRDNPRGMTEEWPTRPAKRLFYAQEKAELEHLLHDEAVAHPDPQLYVLRPPVVIGPHTLGAKKFLPEPLNTIGARLAGAVLPLRLALPVLVPDLTVQFIHEHDVGQALLQCAVGAGPPGAYNIAGDGVMTGSEIANQLGFAAIPIPDRIVRATARAVARLPLPPQAEWVEAATQPAIIDSTKAKLQLGWKPRYTSSEALRDTIQRLTDRDKAGPSALWRKLGLRRRSDRFIQEERPARRSP